MENIESLTLNNEQNVELADNSEMQETKTAESIEKEETTLDNNEEKTVEKEVEHYFTNETTKAVACMLRDVITDYELAKEMEPDAENVGRYGYDKILPKINMLEVLPEEWRKFKLARILSAFVDGYVSEILDVYWDRAGFMFLPDNHKVVKNSFQSLYVVLAKITASYADYYALAEFLISNDDRDGERYIDFLLGSSPRDRWDCEETILVARQLSDYLYCKEGMQEDTYQEDYFCELGKKYPMIDMVPSEFRELYLADLFKQNIMNGLPSFEEIDPITGECKRHKYYDLMIFLACYAYRVRVDFVNIAEEYLKDGLKSLKGLRETYPNF